jgi:DNA-binding NarL/FixJ family response regulator
MKILIIENEALVRIGIRTVLLAEGDFEVIGEAESSASGLQLVAERNPDVVLMSLRLKETCAIDDIIELKKIAPDAKVIILASHPGDGEISKAIERGASGYLLKDVTPEQLVGAIRAVAKGKSFLQSEVADILDEHRGSETLTPTESAVLRLLVGSLTNMEIAFAMDVSENTVKTHVKNIFSKLGVTDRTAATTTAIKRGLVRMDV